jgi:hypothetical protein
MKYADRIRQAKSIQESLLVIAEGIDAVLDAQAAGPSTLVSKPDGASGRLNNLTSE